MAGGAGLSNCHFYCVYDTALGHVSIFNLATSEVISSDSELVTQKF